MAQRLDLLTDTRRAAIRSRRSVRDAIQWSYDLLDGKEQEVFTRLALLPGGFDQQSAAAVTTDLGLSRPQLWALLAGPARKSVRSSTSRLGCSSRTEFPPLSWSFSNMID
uniref:hypothetical protein n=1 Tax=Paractinoplanes polyasparticus TaxID=2856853 RepID=UPI001C84C170|nr:hypothetical protein [Actinoplanes polyasparticus]